MMFSLSLTMDNIMLFKKSQHGWRLLKQGTALLAEQKKIWILPLIGRGFFFLLLVALSLVTWSIRSGMVDYRSLSGKEIFWGYVIILLILWMGNLVSAYYNAAFTACLLQLERGEKMSLWAGMRAADRRFWTILSWIVMHFTFGFVVTAFRNKLTQVEQINRWLCGLRWPFACFLFQPLIINEPAGFFKTLQRSSELISQSVGKNPSVNFSYMLLSLMMRLVSTLPVVIGFHLHQPLWIAIGGTLSFMLLLGVVTFFNGISVTILYAYYQFLAHGKTVRHFQTQDIATILAENK